LSSAKLNKRALRHTPMYQKPIGGGI